MCGRPHDADRLRSFDLTLPLPLALAFEVNTLQASFLYSCENKTEAVVAWRVVGGWQFRGVEWSGVGRSLV